MPDLSRERRDRSRQSLDQRVAFRIAVQGVNDFGEPESTFTEWSGWGRRDDADIDTLYQAEVSGIRELGEVRLITRFDDRIVVGPESTFTVAGDAFRITLVEEVGRRRYMRLAGVRTT